MKKLATIKDLKSINPIEDDGCNKPVIMIIKLKPNKPEFTLTKKVWKLLLSFHCLKKLQKVIVFLVGTYK